MFVTGGGFLDNFVLIATFSRIGVVRATVWFKLVKPPYLGFFVQVTDYARKITCASMSHLPPPICYSKKRGEKDAARAFPARAVFYLINAC